MNNIHFEELIGKNYRDINNILDCNLRINNHKEGYAIETEFMDGSFCGMNYNFITLLTDEDEITKSIIIHFTEIMDKDFYDNFIRIYGEPNNISVSKKRQIISSGVSKEKNFLQDLKKIKIDLVEGTFDDKPVLIRWEKKDFSILATQKYNHGTSDIRFITNN